MFRRHPILSLVTFAYLGFVGWVTLGPQPLDGRGNALLWRVLRFFAHNDLLNWITYQRIEFTANVLMFVPVGMFLLLLFGRRFWFVCVLVGVGMTAAIEFVQLFLPGRVSDVSDIIANSVGTLIGVLIALAVTASKARRVRDAERAASRNETRILQPTR